MVHSLFVTVCAYGLLALSSITTLSEHRVPSITALASNQCTIPFGRKWYNGKRKCRQQPARQVLACNSRDAKRNPLPARAAGSGPAATRLFPFLSRCAAPFRETRQRQAEPPARQSTQYVQSQPRSRSWSCAVTTLPSRAGDSVWPVSTSFLVSAVFSVSAVPFRHRSLAKRNGAFAVRYCLHLRVTRSIVNVWIFGSPC